MKDHGIYCFPVAGDDDDDDDDDDDNGGGGGGDDDYFPTHRMSRTVEPWQNSCDLFVAKLRKS